MRSAEQSEVIEKFVWLCRVDATILISQYSTLSRVFFLQLHQYDSILMLDSMPAIAKIELLYTLNSAQATRS